MNRENKRSLPSFTIEDMLLYGAYVLLMKPYFALMIPLVSNLWDTVILIICVTSLAIYVFHRVNKSLRVKFQRRRV